MTADNDTSSNRQLRCFLAAPVTDELADALVTSMEASLEDLPPLKVTPRDNLHLTLVFLGNLGETTLDEQLVPAVTRILESANPGRVYFRQVAGFPSTESPKHLVLEGYGSPSAESLRDALNSGLADLKASGSATRQWRPHITLGRFRDPESSSITPTPWQAELPVGEVVLYESETTMYGPVYRARHRWTLGTPAA